MHPVSPAHTPIQLMSTTCSLPFDGVNFGSPWSQRVELQLNPQAPILWPRAWLALVPDLRPATGIWTVYCRDSSDVKFLKKSLPQLHQCSTFFFIVAVVFLVLGFIKMNRLWMLIGVAILCFGFLGPIIFGAARRWAIYGNIMDEVKKFSDSVGKIVEPYGFKVVPGGAKTAQSMPEGLTPVGCGLYFWLDLGLPVGRTTDIQRLPTFPYEVDLASKDQPMCVICMDEFSEGETLRQLPCGHRFHILCIDAWLQRNDRCPTCKADFHVGLLPPQEVTGQPLVLIECEPESPRTPYAPVSPVVFSTRSPDPPTETLNCPREHH